MKVRLGACEKMTAEAVERDGKFLPALCTKDRVHIFAHSPQFNSYFDAALWADAKICDAFRTAQKTIDKWEFLV